MADFSGTPAKAAQPHPAQRDPAQLNPAHVKATQRTARLGLAVAVSTAVIGVASYAIAVTTLPRSGPWCTSDCLRYPYTGGATWVPRDFVWMYPATVLVALFVVLVAVLARLSPAAGGVADRLATAFAASAAAVVAVDYGIQLLVVQPSLLAGETDGLSLVSQYNPHGIFIALEVVGYVLMALAFLAAAALVDASSRVGGVLRWLLVVGGLAVPVALVVMAIAYGGALDYRFEVVALSIDWLVLIVSSVLLAVLFGRARRVPPGPPAEQRTFAISTPRR